MRLIAGIVGLFILTLALSGLISRAASTVAAVADAPAHHSAPVESVAYPAWTVGRATACGASREPPLRRPIQERRYRCSGR